MNRVWKLTLAVTVAAVFAGCNGQKAPAETAVNAAESAFGAIAADARAYLPSQASEIQSAINSARSALASGDYATALASAQAVPAKVADLTTAIAARKTALTQAWTNAAASVPGLIGALKSRVDILSQSRHLPAGLTTTALDAAKSGLATVTQAWADASAAAQSGDVAAAGTSALAVKTQVIDLMKSLNMQVPASLQ
jgi:hypothetical protein